MYSYKKLYRTLGNQPGQIWVGRRLALAKSAKAIFFRRAKATYTRLHFLFTKTPQQHYINQYVGRSFCPIESALDIEEAGQVNSL